MKNVYTQNRGYRLIIPAKETRERRAGFLITRADYIEFDPFPLRHFESTSSFAKKRRLSSSTSSFSSFLPLFPFSPRSHSTSRHEFSSYPLSRYPLPPRLPPLSLSRRGFPPLPSSPSPPPRFLPFSRKPTSFSSPGLLYKTTKEHRGRVKMAVGFRRGLS